MTTSEIIAEHLADLSSSFPLSTSYHDHDNYTTTIESTILRTSVTMSARVAARRLFTTSARRFQEHEKQELKRETKRNPELMVRHNLRYSR